MFRLWPSRTLKDKYLQSSMFNYAMHDYKYVASENYGTFVFTA